MEVKQSIAARVKIMDEKPNTKVLLEQLYGELELVRPANERQQTSVDGVKASLQNVMNPDANAADHHTTLIERLNDAISHLEGEHPSLAATMNVVVEALSNMGL
jgi:hypothetical protein